MDSDFWFSGMLSTDFPISLDLSLINVFGSLSSKKATLSKIPGDINEIEFVLPKGKFIQSISSATHIFVLFKSILAVGSCTM